MARPRSKSAARLRYRPEGFVFAAVILCAVAGFIFSLVLLNIYLAQSSFRLAELEKSIAEQEALARRMRYQVAAAESPGRLAEASLRMGLVAPDRLEYVSAAGPSPARPAEGSSTLEKLAASRAAMRRGGAA